MEPVDLTTAKLISSQPSTTLYPTATAPMVNFSYLVPPTATSANPTTVLTPEAKLQQAARMKQCVTCAGIVCGLIAIALLVSFIYGCLSLISTIYSVRKVTEVATSFAKSGKSAINGNLNITQDLYKDGRVQPMGVLPVLKKLIPGSKQGANRSNVRLAYDLLKLIT